MNRHQSRLIDAIGAVESAARRLSRSVVDRRDIVERAVEDNGRDPDLLESLDAFVQRYQQLVEHLTHRLYPAMYRIAQGERAPFLGTLLTEFEGRGLLASANAWKVRLELRNRLVHEYPLDPQERAIALKSAIAQSLTMLDDVRTAIAVVHDEHWLEDLP